MLILNGYVSVGFEGEAAGTMVAFKRDAGGTLTKLNEETSHGGVRAPS